MTVTTVYKQGWTMDDVHWSLFDPQKVEPTLLAAIKAAALVEYNAPDYVVYLKRIFADSSAATLASIEQWGQEECQHGLALGRWAELADPDFKLEEAFVRFRKSYTPNHFAVHEAVSVRGSRRGEMIARCVVESCTSSYYSAIRDAAEEPVLKEIAGRIAADEYRHYKLFYDTLNAQTEPDIGFWKRMMIAVGRVRESDDDELAYAYYAANHREDGPYDRRTYARAYARRAYPFYRQRHVELGIAMILKAIGVRPRDWLTARLARIAFGFMRMRADRLAKQGA